jgi:hypothetical protein
MASTVQRAVTLLQWQQQKQQGGAGSSSDPSPFPDEYLAGVSLPTLTLPVEILLLAPSADMASTCMQLITLLAEQANAAERTHVSDVYADCAVSSALQLLGPAVYHAAQRVDSLKQRRQLMRLWSEVLRALLHLKQGRCWRRQVCASFTTLMHSHSVTCWTTIDTGACSALYTALKQQCVALKHNKRYRWLQCTDHWHCCIVTSTFKHSVAAVACLWQPLGVANGFKPCS